MRCILLLATSEHGVRDVGLIIDASSRYIALASPTLRLLGGSGTCTLYWTSHCRIVQPLPTSRKSTRVVTFVRPHATMLQRLDRNAGAEIWEPPAIA